MTKPLIVARATSTMQIEHQKNLRDVLTKQLGDEYTVLVVPPHVDIHMLQTGQAIKASVQEIRWEKVPRAMGFFESLLSLFPARKTKEAAHG